MPNSLKCKIKHLRHNGTLTERECDRILKALEQQPTRPTAGWGKFDDDYIKCSKCERIVKFYHYNYKYCPHCGARMVESEDKE